MSQQSNQVDNEVLDAKLEVEIKNNWKAIHGYKQQIENPDALIENADEQSTTGKLPTYEELLCAAKKNVEQLLSIKELWLSSEKALAYMHYLGDVLIAFTRGTHKADDEDFYKKICAYILDIGKLSSEEEWAFEMKEFYSCWLHPLLALGRYWVLMNMESENNNFMPKLERNLSRCLSLIYRGRGWLESKSSVISLDILIEQVGKIGRTQRMRERMEERRKKREEFM